MTLKAQVAAFRRGYAAGVDNRERDEHDNSYAAGHLAGYTAFMTYWIAELEAGKVESDHAFQPLPAATVMRLALRLESGRALRLMKALMSSRQAAPEQPRQVACERYGVCGRFGDRSRVRRQELPFRGLLGAAEDEYGMAATGPT
jgi:hypothetical protein